MRTESNIAINDYLPLLDRLKSYLTKDSKVLILANRFFGTPELIAACQCHDWSWRIRLKVNLTIHHDGGELSVSDIANLSKVITGANLYGGGNIINIGYIHDRGHKEAWFIAMNVQPTRKTTLDYGLRWSIESMFSDFKSRSFGLQNTQQRPDRISRILLVLALALTWATTNGYIE